MGHVRLFGRRLTMSTDDFFLPAMIGLGNRVVFLGCEALLALMLSPIALLLEKGCGAGAESWEERVAFYGTLGFAGLLAVSLALYAAIFFVSTRGTPCDHSKRTSIPALLVAQLLCYFVELLVACGLVVLLALWPLGASSASCSRLAEQRLVVTGVSVAFIWADLLALCVASWLFFRSYDPERVRGAALDSFDRGVVAWEGCLRVWCGVFRVLTFNLFGYVGDGDEADEVFRSVAEVFNSWFHDTGLGITDLLLGFVLVRLDQKQQLKSYKRYIPVDNSGSEFYKQAHTTDKKAYNLIGGSVRAMTPSTPELKSPPGAPKSAKVDLELDLESGRLTPEKQPRGASRQTKPLPQPDDYDSEHAYKIFAKHYDYLPYIIGIYGWKLEMYASAVRFRPLTGLRKVMHAPGQAPDVGHGDNCCRCSQQQLVSETGIDPADIIYGNFDSVDSDERRSISVPHALFVDHRRKAVVLALRGTLSLQDLMTDAMLEPEPLTTPGRIWGFNGAGHYAHSGMLKIAMRVRLLLERSGVLHRMFRVDKQVYDTIDNSETNNKEALNIDMDKLPDTRGYELLIMGHSLGAGVATVLTLMLHSRFPEARCMSYANPGAVFSYELAEQSKAWCTNIWLGNDMVPHLNWQSLQFLRLKILEVLWRCKVSKARALRSAVFGSSLDDLLYESFEVPSYPERDVLKDKLEYFRSKKPSSRVEEIPMYAPGVLIHMAKVETVGQAQCGGMRTKKVRVFEPHLVPDRRVMVEPIISTRSLFDHFPDLLPEVMGVIYERHTAMRKQSPNGAATPSTISIASPQM